jgi:acetyl esterase/lipase
LVAIHGGSWIGGSPRLYRIDPESTAARLARAGLVVVAPEYRLARPGAPSWPAVLVELREVVRWVRRHASELDVDPSRIAALGQSAGGQLAALLGTLPDQPGPDGVSARVNAVIDFYGPSDLARLVETRHLAHDPVRLFLGEQAANDPVALRDASPIEHVTNDDAPMLLLHGSDDAWVPPEQSARLAAALERAGVRHKLILIEGVRHGFEARVNTSPQRDLLSEILGFLRSVWN